ncbi:YhjD/YihY/BrkB family envelope integrity protein [Candidatus Methylocalor cossyra]|uniref:Ribonuclease BN n=1 Tax=Candidatus Methylocalor cossyra TaxID=3108543 RepID=A0ABM9NIP0_9GAMM
MTPLSPAPNPAGPPLKPPRWRALWQAGRRLVEALLRDVTVGGLDLRATSLVYTTLLSLAPLLAVSFSVLKAFGAHNQMRPFLLELFSPLGAPAAEITDRIIGFVNNLEVGVLGFTGFALLFWTVLSLLNKIEHALNAIWRVDRERSFRRRFSDYLSVLLVGPVLLFSALGIMATLASHAIVQTIIALEPFGTLYYLLMQILPTLFIIGAFSFLYLFIPNTRVSFKAALIGGIVAGLTWRVVGRLFGTFVAGSAQYAAIYSSFAILIVFMIWLYLDWLILLVGADVAFYVQHPRYLRLSWQDPNRLGPGVFRRLGLLLMYLMAQRFQRGEPPWTKAELAARLDLPDQVVERALAALQRGGLILPVDGEETAFMPARELCATSVREVLEALQAEPGDSSAGTALAEPAVDRILAQLRQAVDQAVEGLTVKDLAADRETPREP